MPTKSYCHFISNMGTVGRLKETYHDIRQARGKRGRAAFDHITRSAIVFLASSFEVYIEDVLRECCLQHISFAKDAVKLPHDVKNTINTYVKQDSNSAPPINLCDEGWRDVYKTITNNRAEKLNTPKKKNISLLFKDLIGITENNIDCIIGINNLDGVIHFRGEIAHRVKADKYVNVEEVENNEKIIVEIATNLDRVILKCFKEFYPNERLPWNDAY